MAECFDCQRPFDKTNIHVTADRKFNCQACFMKYLQNHTRDFESNNYQLMFSQVENGKFSEKDLMYMNIDNLSEDHYPFDKPNDIKMKKIYSDLLKNLNLERISHFKDYNEKILLLNKFADSYKNILWKYTHLYTYMIDFAKANNQGQHLSEEIYLLQALLYFEIGQYQEALSFLKNIQISRTVSGFEYRHIIKKYLLILIYLGPEYFKKNKEILKEVKAIIQYYPTSNLVPQFGLKLWNLFKNKSDSYSKLNCIHALQSKLDLITKLPKYSKLYLDELKKIKKYFKATNGEFLTQVRIYKYISDHYKLTGNLADSILYLKKGICILKKESFENTYIMPYYELKLVKLSLRTEDLNCLYLLKKILENLPKQKNRKLSIRACRLLKHYYIIKNEPEKLNLIKKHLNHLKTQSVNN